jgi:hypothetical protein
MRRLYGRKRLNPQRARSGYARTLAPCRSHSFAGQLAGLLHPSCELSFVELVVLMEVEGARRVA